MELVRDKGPLVDAKQPSVAKLQDAAHVSFQLQTRLELGDVLKMAFPIAGQQHAVIGVEFAKAQFKMAVVAAQ